MTSLGMIGGLVREARLGMGLRQSDVADRAGVSRYTLIKLERGQLSDINFKTLANILAVLHLEVRIDTARVGRLPVLGE